MKTTFGANDLSTRESFIQRYRYANYYPVGIRDYRYINLWYNEMLFGRVDREGDVVYPAPGFLKQLKGTDELSYFVLDFVADAYEEFRQTMLSHERENHFVNLDGTPFENRFVPTKAWTNTNAAYNAYLTNYFATFIASTFSDPTILDEVFNFDDYVLAFTRLLDRTTLLVPFTKTAYIPSKLASPLNSGLIIEFADELDHGDDYTKITEFVNNVNFELFREIASRHGFAVDMNAPWRLIADVGSDAMQRYMGKYNQNLDTMFEHYYYNSSFYEIPNLKVLLPRFYNIFINAQPQQRSEELVDEKNTGKSLTKVINRAILSPEELDRKYNNLFWIRLYMYIRAKETNRDWNQDKFDHLVKKASDFFLYADEKSALKFINKEMRQTPEEYAASTKGRRGSFRFKRKRE